MAETIEPNEMDGAAKVAKKLNLSTGDVNSITDSLKENLPDAGTLAAGLMAGPIGFTLAASSVILRHSTENQGEQDKEFDELAELFAKPMGASVEDYNKHVQNGKQAVANLQSALARAGTDTDPIGTHFRMVRAFMDVFIEGVKNEVVAQGRLTEATLLKENASSQQIVTARQQTRAKIQSLGELRSFFDGSGLLMLEQAARQKAQSQLSADSNAAVLTQQQLTAKNEDRLKEIQSLNDATGKGQLAANDPAFISDQKKTADAQEALDRAEKFKKTVVEQALHDGISPAGLKELVKPYDESITEARLEVEEVKRQVQQKSAHLSQLEVGEDEGTREQADATVIAQQKTEEATKNQHRIDELPGDIADAQLKERMQQAFNAQVAATDTQTDKTLASLPPAIFGGTGAAGGRRLDPDRLNDILSGLILEQDALKKSLAESQKKQAQMEQEIEELQRGHDLHTRQIRSANANRF